MTIERDATRIVRSWLKTDEHESADRVLGLVLDSLDGTPQSRPLWRSWRRHAMSGTFKVATAAMAALVVVAIVGAIYFSRPAVGPVGSPSPTPSAPTQFPTLEPNGLIGVVAYIGQQEGNRIWVVNTDGTNAHELLPDSPGWQTILGWSRDGSRLLFEGESIFWTDAAGSNPQLLCAASATECPHLTGALSPDGTRVAYVSSDTDTSTVAIVDLATSEVTKLESTKAPLAIAACDSAVDAGRNDAPKWSPDGSQLAFSRGYFGMLPDGNTNCRQSVVYVINADGSGLRQLTSADMVAFHPEWSPDGTTIAFGGDERKPSALRWSTDLYTISADGTDMRALTTSGGSWGEWTTDGRIVLSGHLGDPPTSKVRFFEPDGGGETQIDADDVAALTAAGCVICPHGLGTGNAYWQPLP